MIINSIVCGLTITIINTVLNYVKYHGMKNRIKGITVEIREPWPKLDVIL
ncbi:MAG: hypothetical protein RSB80_05245 [Anaerovoracaceae bacterium]